LRGSGKGGEGNGGLKERQSCQRLAPRPCQAVQGFAQRMSTHVWLIAAGGKVLCELTDVGGEAGKLARPRAVRRFRRAGSSMSRDSSQNSRIAARNPSTCAEVKASGTVSSTTAVCDSANRRVSCRFSSLLSRCFCERRRADSRSASRRRARAASFAASRAAVFFKKASCWAARLARSRCLAASISCGSLRMAKGRVDWVRFGMIGGRL
jgi:hypothetical protein